MTKEYVKERYDLLFELYGVQSRGWSMLHEQFNRYVFCPDNRKSLIAEYLVWEDAKKFNVPYYMGIDSFLKNTKARFIHA